MEELKGRVAAITGAASGIGRATALLLARQGCAIALIDIDEQRLSEVAAEVEALGVRATSHLADVADPVRMEALVGEIVGAHGAVHILVNNAGVSVLKRFEEHTLEDFQWLVGINFWGVVHGCKFFLPELRRAEEAHIVNISSMFGIMGVPGQSSYCATKFAVRGFTESLWAELRETSVGVTSIHPGGVSTGIHRTVRAASDAARAQLTDNLRDHGHPPEDVAAAILKGIRKNRLRVITGAEAFVVDWLKRLIPISAHKWVAWRMNPLGGQARER